MAVTDVRTRPTGAVVTGLAAVLAVIGGDAAMVGVAGFAKTILEEPLLQWAFATAVIAVGSYFLFGYTQIKAWQSGKHDEVEDSRSRWATKRLGAGGRIAFVAASIIGGPLAVGWYYGRLRHPKAHQAAMASALILAAFWSVVYLGIINLLF